MPQLIAIFLVLGVICVLVYAKFHNSKGIEKFTDDLTHEESHDFKETDVLISDAQQADDALDQRVENNEKAVEQIKKDTAAIEEFKTDIDETPKGGK